MPAKVPELALLVCYVGLGMISLLLIMLGLAALASWIAGRYKRK